MNLVANKPFDMSHLIKTIVKKGDAVKRQFLGYSIPANMEHSLEIIGPGEIIDVFTPVREDYL